jgi:hypothetical protein
MSPSLIDVNFRLIPDRKKVWSQANPGIGRYGPPKFQNMVNYQSKTVKSFNEKMQKKIF